MKIIFLDFDGVINPIAYHYNASGFSPAACANLQSILLKEPQARIVVSSSWRRWGLKDVRDILQSCGIESTKVIDITDGEGGWEPENRASQIKRWLEKHKNIKNFIILDDFPMPDYAANYVKINGYIGITQKDVEIALNKLK